jgi:hypothetical protein
VLAGGTEIVVARVVQRCRPDSCCDVPVATGRNIRVWDATTFRCCEDLTAHRQGDGESITAVEWLGGLGDHVFVRYGDAYRDMSGDAVVEFPVNCLLMLTCCETL